MKKIFILVFLTLSNTAFAAGAKTPLPKLSRLVKCELAIENFSTNEFLFHKFIQFDFDDNKNAKLFVEMPYNDSVVLLRIDIDTWDIDRQALIQFYDDVAVGMLGLEQDSDDTNFKQMFSHQLGRTSFRVTSIDRIPDISIYAKAPGDDPIAVGIACKSGN